jgi:hypothetical protein
MKIPLNEQITLPGAKSLFKFFSQNKSGAKRMSASKLDVFFINLDYIVTETA